VCILSIGLGVRGCQQIRRRQQCYVTDCHSLCSDYWYWLWHINLFFDFPPSSHFHSHPHFSTGSGIQAGLLPKMTLSCPQCGTDLSIVRTQDARNTITSTAPPSPPTPQ
jgi:hypothetical protein